MGGIRRANNGRNTMDSGKVWTSLGGALVGGMLGGLSGNPLAMAQGVISGGMKGAEIFDTFSPQKPRDPYEGLGVTAKARAMRMRPRP
jgi:outer membrane lipoprotein SlyB